ncbi:hypothetical protein GKE82_04505 [Conexibacter sp. W3-3-2]|uniref:PRC-barrel domain-containing protein n=1 Tax=Paraconexibacter algicola TaxID=2133960 RepID=A0A2T4UDD1_9ACTN|nr:MULTISPECIES: hypothetical protein [Solirubrobacterales]MTD43583.1 hypothetical protein [Conexibacter sp. W3-3-2]PTL55509.1 hypothetical protein C7Y72_17825 [Paraconexibacter algicola]
MSSVGEIPSWVGTRVEGLDGRPVGRVEAVQIADRAACPTGLLVRLSDGSRALVPLQGARRGPGVVRVPVH